MMLFFLLMFGLILLIAGGEFLVRAAVGLARRFGVPPLLIGLTVVALGTSAPELMVAVEASLKGAPDIVTGGVIGSSIANILLVLGVSALITPICKTICANSIRCLVSPSWCFLMPTSSIIIPAIKPSILWASSRQDLN